MSPENETGAKQECLYHSLMSLISKNGNAYLNNKVLNAFFNLCASSVNDAF